MNEEAMERALISITSDNIKPKEWVGQDSMGQSIPRSPLSSSSSDEKVLSRYLRPSMSSCHDFCKYGKKHASEAKEKHSILRRFLRNNIVPDGEQNLVSDLNQEERRKRTVIKPKAPSKVPKQKILLPGEQIGSSEALIDIRSETPLPTKKSIASAKKNLLRSRDNERNQVKSLNPGNGKKTQVTKPRIPLQPKPSPNKPNVIKLKDLSPFFEVNASGKPDIIKKKTKAPVNKPLTSFVPKVIKQKAPPSVNKLIASAKLQNVNPKPPLPTKRTDVSAKPAVSLKKKAPLVRSISQLTPSGSLRRNRENKIIKSLGASKIGEKKVLKQLTASLTSKTPGEVIPILKPRKPRIVKRVSFVKNREKVGKHGSGYINEKTLDNTQPKSEKKFNKQGEIEESGSAISGVSDKEIENNNNIKASKGEDKRRVRRTATVHPEDNTSTPYKLKFRRGKVIDLRSESIGPRRLRFRRVRVAGENPSGHGEVGRRSFKRRRDLGGGDPNSEAQSVVLKHQDMQQKKEMQVLFNNVIEETASKLVESRKSKVKALVGAFETVISLQESKPGSSL